jgi:2-succinyl-6-hydroxy-2,4-cyclohexadiene-1-carboxylate synthase
MATSAAGDSQVAPQLAHVVHDGNGPPALLVHGFLASAAYWRPNLAALSAVCRPVVVELWGHGRSPSPAEPAAYQPAGFVAAFERLRRRLGHERWVVISHSLGAALGLHYALAEPRRVIGLVVTNSQSAFADGDREQMVGVAARLAERVEREGMDTFANHPMNPARSRRLPADSQAELVDALAGHDPVGVAGVLRWTLPGASVVDRLDQLGVPTMLAWGTYEASFAAGAALAAERIPDLQVAHLAAGHAVNLTDRAGFDRAVCDFLTALG